MNISHVISFIHFILKDFLANWTTGGLIGQVIYFIMSICCCKGAQCFPTFQTCYPAIRLLCQSGSRILVIIKLNNVSIVSIIVSFKTYIKVYDVLSNFPSKKPSELEQQCSNEINIYSFYLIYN